MRPNRSDARMESRKPMRIVHLPTVTLARQRRCHDVLHYNTGRPGFEATFQCLAAGPVNRLVFANRTIM